MAEAHLDHPGEITWFAGSQPRKGTGELCNHPCDHNFTLGNIAWGPDYEHYVLNECRECGCRGWAQEYPEPHTKDRPKHRQMALMQTTPNDHYPPIEPEHEDAVHEAETLNREAHDE